MLWQDFWIRSTEFAVLNKNTGLSLEFLGALLRLWCPHLLCLHGFSSVLGWLLSLVSHLRCSRIFFFLACVVLSLLLPPTVRSTTPTLDLRGSTPDCPEVNFVGFSHLWKGFCHRLYVNSQRLDVHQSSLLFTWCTEEGSLIQWSFSAIVVASVYFRFYGMVGVFHVLVICFVFIFLSFVLGFLVLDSSVAGSKPFMFMEWNCFSLFTKRKITIIMNLRCKYEETKMFNIK